MSYDTTIYIFNHRMYYTLWVYNDFYIIISYIKKFMSFYNFKSFIY